MSKIIEAAETPALTRIVTVRTNRGDEYRVDVDAAALAVADLISDHANEKRQGWTLNAGWFEGELRKLNKACLR